MPRLAFLITLVLTALLLAGCSSLFSPASLPGTSTLPSTQLLIETRSPLPSSPPETATITPIPDPAQWVWTFNPADRTLLQISPMSNTVIGKVTLKGRPVAVATGESSVWVITQSKNGNDLLRIHPVSLQIETNISISQGTALSLAAAEGSVWVGYEAPATDLPVGMESSRPGGLLRIDPLTNQVTDILPAPSAAAQILVYDHHLWVLEWLEFYSLLNRIDPVSLQIQSIPPELKGMRYVHQFARIALNRAGLWAISLNPGSHFIYHVNPESGEINRAIQVGEKAEDIPVDLLADDAGVWVALRSGWVVLVNPDQAKIITSLQAHPGLSGLFSAAGALWVTNQPAGEIYRIDPKARQLVTWFSTGSKLPPTQTPTPIVRPGEGQCQAAYPTRLHKGERAIVTGNPPLPNRLRSEPGLKGNILGEIPPGHKMLLLEGPACANNWWWWKVQAEDGQIGWTAEGDRENYWLAPAK